MRHAVVAPGRDAERLRVVAPHPGGPGEPRCGAVRGNHEPGPDLARLLGRVVRAPHPRAGHPPVANEGLQGIGLFHEAGAGLLGARHE